MSDLQDQDAVERVLRGLRAQAREGLEGRVLAGMAARVPARRAARRAFRRRLGWSLATAVFAGGVWVGTWHGHAVTPAKKVVAVADASSSLGESAASAELQSPEVKEIARAIEPAHGAAVVPRATPAGKEAQMVLEASFPAPEMPLTEQERLLRVIAQRRVNGEIAAIPVSRLVAEDAQYRAQIEEFEEFFYVPPYVEPEPPAPAASTTNAGQPGKNTGGL